MIWFTLALFVISFLLTALLTPKPEFEDARAQTLDNVDFPRATENAPIPLILGKVRVTAPNTIWCGNFSSIAITEKVKTGLFSSTRVTVGHRYFLTLDLALAMGPNIVLTEIFMDDKSLWTGSTSGTGPTNFQTSNGSFFGGYKSGGGWDTANRYYPGAFDLASQPVDGTIEGLVGAGNVPAYLGVAHIVMNGEIGESAQLRKMAFVLESYTNDLGGLPDNAKVGEDMNPAEAIYQVFTNKWRGMGVTPADLDLVALRALGNTCHAEGNGVSIQVTAETQGSKVIQEILRQIDGVAYQDPETGRIVFKLIRNDYDVNALDTYDEDDIIKVVNFSRTGWDEVVAQVKITFPQRDKDSDKVALSQDMATAGMIGRLRSTTMSMPFCYDPTLANSIASRERAQLSVPLFRITLEMNRNGNRLRPGSVFKLDWPEYGFTGLVMRVQEFDFGSLLDGRLVVKCLQDSFAVNSVVFGDPAGSGWVPPVVDPGEILLSDIIEMPRFFQNRVQFPIPDGNAGVIPVALPPTANSDSFDMVVGTATGDANLDTREPEYAPYQATGTLVSDYDADEGFVSGVDAVGLTITNLSGTLNPASSTAILKEGEDGLFYLNGEWMGFTSYVDNLDGTFTLQNVHRGLLGTRPRNHSASDRFWAVSPELMGLGTLDDLTETGTVFYKLLDRIGAKSFGIGDATEASKVMQDIADRPARPRNLRLDGSRTPPQVGTSDLDITWVNSNREASLITFEGDPTEVPDQAEQYDLDVFVGGVLNGTLSATNITSPHTIPFSSTGFNESNCEMRLYSKRTGGDLKSSADYAWLPFAMQQNVVLTPLVITNPDAETGDITGWNNGGGTFTIRGSNPAPDQGSFYFFGGASATPSAYQDVAVPVSEESKIDAGTALIKVDWIQRSFANSDEGNIKLEFFNSGMTSLGTDPGPGLIPASSTQWDARTTGFVSVPANTRTVRITMECNRAAGGNCDAYFDTITGGIG